MAVEVWAWLWENAPAEMTPGEMLVGLCLANHANGDGLHAYPGIKKIARETRLTARTVTRALAGLLDKGLIATEAEATNTFPAIYLFPGFARDKKSHAKHLDKTKSLAGIDNLSVGLDNLSPKPSENRQGTVTAPPAPPNGVCRWAAAVGDDRLAAVTARFEAANIQLDGSWLRRTVGELEHQVPGLSTAQITDAVRSTLFKAEDALGRDHTIRNPRAFVAKELRTAIQEKGQTR